MSITISTSCMTQPESDGLEEICNQNKLDELFLRDIKSFFDGVNKNKKSRTGKRVSELTLVIEERLSKAAAHSAHIQRLKSIPVLNELAVLSVSSFLILSALLISYHFFGGLSWLASTGIIDWAVEKESLFCQIIVACLIVYGLGKVSIEMCKLCLRSLACLTGIDVKNVPAPKSASSCCVRFFNRVFKGCKYLGLFICSLVALVTLLLCYYFFHGLSWLASTGIIGWVIEHGSFICQIIVACLIVYGFGKVSIALVALMQKQAEEMAKLKVKLQQQHEEQIQELEQKHQKAIQKLNKLQIKKQ